MSVATCSCGCGRVVGAGSRFARGHNNTTRWTAESIVAAVQRWTREHGFAPTHAAWNRVGVPRGEYPTGTTVQKVFGSWHAALDAAGVLPVREQRWRTLDPAFGHWLAGLIAGEGSFNIEQKRWGGFRTTMQLGLRDDNTAILREIRIRLGLGSIYRQVKGDANPRCVWMVMSLGDAHELVEILDCYPLRAKKADDYAIWREAVRFWSEVLRGQRRGQREWGRMAELKQQLEHAREYQPPIWPVAGAAQPAERRRDIGVSAPSCSIRSVNKPRRWTGELIVAAIRQWTVTYGSPPTYAAWNRTEACGDMFPAASTVRRVFGSWHAALVEAGVLPVRERRWRNLDPGFGCWLAGLIDGEGSFAIDRAKGSYYGVSLAVALRDDDAVILQEIQLRLGLG